MNTPEIGEVHTELAKLDPKWAGKQGPFVVKAMLDSCLLGYVPVFTDGNAEIPYDLLVDESPRLVAPGTSYDEDARSIVAGLSPIGYFNYLGAEGGPRLRLHRAIATVSVGEWEILSRFAENYRQVAR